MRSKVLPRLIRFEMERRGAWSCDPSRGDVVGCAGVLVKPFFFPFLDDKKSQNEKEDGWVEET